MIQIESMCAEDLEQVAVLAGQLGYPSTLEQIVARFRTISAFPDYALFVAKDSSGDVVGWAQVNKESAALVVDDKAELSALVVDERHRGQKIGARLVAKAEEWAQAHGLKQLRVRSNITRTDAHRFYQREGYVLKKTGHNFLKDL